MLNEIKGNVWQMLDENSAVCILTNQTVCSQISSFNLKTKVFNPMGGGIAKEAKDRNPGLDVTCAQAILSNKFSLGIDKISGAEMLRFSTKDQIQYHSDMRIIANSLIELCNYIKENPNKKIYLPRPGCGLGGLEWEDVKELCEHYLKDYDNVFIVSF